MSFLSKGMRKYEAYVILVAVNYGMNHDEPNTLEVNTVPKKRTGEKQILKSTLDFTINL
ncbi:MAG: hypothetical protein ACI90V_012758 [Bacillariaceae sp.]|jgi:hypothetical protein